MEVVNENEGKENCVLSWRSLEILLSRNRKRGRQQQITCIQNKILIVNIYHYEHVRLLFLASAA